MHLRVQQTQPHTYIGVGEEEDLFGGELANEVGHHRQLGVVLRVGSEGQVRLADAAIVGAVFAHRVHAV